MQPHGGSEEREPRLARRSPFVPEIKLCPRCLSPVVSMNSDLMGITPAEYYCQKCGYSGPVYVLKDKDTPQGKS